jgi:hypothetical protein
MTERRQDVPCGICWSHSDRIHYGCEFCPTEAWEPRSPAAEYVDMAADRITRDFYAGQKFDRGQEPKWT